MSIDAFPGLQGKRILIVEDEAFIAMALEAAFEEAGATVVGPAATLDEAMHLTASKELDGAVLDIDLAGLDVFPAADNLVKRQVPFVFQTGHGQRRELKINYPEVRVCKKPIARADLLRALAELL